MIVVDASVLVVALIDDDEDGDTLRDRLRHRQIAAPELIDLEVLSVLRGEHARGALARRRALQAVGDLLELPIDRVPHRSLLARCWELRDNLTAYDAAYVATAERLTAPLLTLDRRLARAPGLRCDVELPL